MGFTSSRRAVIKDIHDKNVEFLMRIANPIYDVVFTYLMEERKDAVLLSGMVVLHW
jgi:hypothetical protein